MPDDSLNQPQRRRDGGRRERSPREHGGQLVVALLVGVLGFAIAVQVSRGEETTAYSSMRGVELVELLKSVDSANDRLSNEVDELTQVRDSLRNSRDRSSRAQKAEQERADRLAVLAGSVGAEGPGIRLTIADRDGAVDATSLLEVVEDLRAAGAEAIVINGTARVVAQTYFLDEGRAVRVGGRQISAPYLIEAIGDPTQLDQSISADGSTLDRLNSRGAKGAVARDKKITITALADVKSPEYAQGG